MKKIQAVIDSIKKSQAYKKAAETGSRIKSADYKSMADKTSSTAYRYSGYAIGGIAAYGGYKMAKNVASEAFIKPYDFKDVKSVAMEGMNPNDTMLFAPLMRETARRGMTPGQFGDSGDLTLSLNNLRRG